MSLRRKATKRLSSYHHDESFINLTPLIDVVFVVLISFILIAPLLEVDMVDLAEGGPRSKNESSRETSISIYVKEDNSIWLNRRSVTDIELTALLKEKKAASPDRIPQVFHDQKASFGTYQKVKNAIERAGFERMDVLLKSGK